MPRTPQKRVVARALPWGFAAAMLLVSTWLWSGWDDRAELAPEPTQDATATRARASLTLPAQGAFEDYRFAIERPLFHPSRRPFPDRKALVALEAAARARPALPSPIPPAPRPPPPSPPQGLQLRGTVIAGPLQSAVFERTGSQTYIRLREGEQLDGWTLVKIDRHQVELTLGDQTVTWPLTRSP